MDTQMSAFDVCRAYIADNANVITNEEYIILLGAIRARDWNSVIRKSAEMEGDSITLCRRKAFRQIGAFFKKNVAFRNAGYCETEANLAFKRGERLCTITNKRLDHFYTHRDRLDPDMRLMIRRAEHYIRSVLGDFKSFQSEIPFRLKITAGATVLHKREDSIPALRFRRTVDVGPRAEAYVKTAYQFFGYPVPRTRIVPWNRLTTVPKNCRTDRMIACEPVGNIPFQLAFDSYCKDRLRLRGIDLRSQTRNQTLARQGSIDGTYSTIDLSMASDTMAFNTVAWLLPKPWFDYLNDLRCTHYSLNGENPDNGNCLVTGKYAKFSSMGNGATFALETLIFSSLAYAAGSRDLCCYGDDIIIETEHVDRLYQLLRFFGFVPNIDKSFSTGLFRESCGGDYYGGAEITPFYIRDEASWDLPNLVHNINGLAAISPYGELWKYLLDIVKRRNLPLVPWNENSTSGVFITPHHAYQRSLFQRRRDGRQRVLAYTNCSELLHIHDSRALALWFLRKQVQGPGDTATFVETSRHTTSARRFRRKWVDWHMPTMGSQGDRKSVV